MNTASDALWELADDEEQYSLLGLDAQSRRAWIATASTADQLTTQECIYNTERLQPTIAAQRQSAKSQKHDPQARLHRRRRRRAHTKHNKAPATRLKDSATTLHDVPDPEVQQEQAPDDRQR